MHKQNGPALPPPRKLDEQDRLKRRGQEAQFQRAGPFESSLLGRMAVQLAAVPPRYGRTSVRA